MNDRVLNVIAGSKDKPLKIGNIEIDCYVLEGEIRVLSQRGIIIGLGMPNPGSVGVTETPRFFTSERMKPFINNDLTESLKNPILFNPPHGGRTAYGYPAEILPKLCNAILSARDAGVLTKRWDHIVKRSHMLIRGLASVGIIALIDEATGYQDKRHREALQTILNEYLLDEARPWVKIFPLEFYKELFRLKGWEWEALPDNKKPNTPSVVGKYTNNLIYQRLFSGFSKELVKELEKINPKNEIGNRLLRHHQWFEEHKGLPLLNVHIAIIIALMRGNTSWISFERSVKRAFPIKGDQDELNLDKD